MTDSDSDVLTYISENSVFRAKGPNIPSMVIMNQNSSHSTMPRNFEKQFQNMEPNYLPRNMYHMRETSPMSLCSFNHQPKNFNASSRQHCMSSQRSMISGRGGSSMSVRSFDSTTSVRSVDITTLIKSAVHFNKHDLRSIMNVTKLMMYRVNRRYKRVQKRGEKNFVKPHVRYKSGNDSSDHASDSSTSSDATRCTTTKSMFAGYNNDKFYKEKAHCDSRSVISSVTDIRNTFKKPISAHSCTDFNNLGGFNQRLNVGTESDKNLGNIFNFNGAKNIKIAPKCLKDRFKSNFLLPSQRFNKTTSNTIEEEIKHGLDDTFRNPHPTLRNANHARNNIDSESEDIFSEIKGNQHCNPIEKTAKRKRNFSVTNDIHGSDKKRAKIDNKSCIDESGKLNEKENIDFMFAKPQIPVKPRKVKEILVSKSAQPIIDVVRPVSKMNEELNNTNEQSNIRENDIGHDTQLGLNSDVSMKPSFLKRKLYTQTLDVTETKNLSLDNIHSPQPSVYKEINKEKNKTRKLVSGQSCLNRDIGQDENNLMNLIQKIVPTEQINKTLASNKSDLKTKKSKSFGKHSKSDPKDDWDITSLISTCDNDNVSETFTDEEIFNIDNDSTKDKKTINEQFNKNNMKICRVDVENIPLESIFKTHKLNMKSKIKNQNPDVQEKVNRIEIDIFNEIKQRDKNEVTKDKGVLQNVSLSKQVRRKAMPVASSLQNPAKKPKIDDKCHLTVSSTARETPKAKNKLQAISHDKKSVVQRVESFWNTVLESDSDIEKDNKHHRDISITKENFIEQPKKVSPTNKPSNQSYASKNINVKHNQACFKESSITKTKSSINQISANAKPQSKSSVRQTKCNNITSSITSNTPESKKDIDKCQEQTDNNNRQDQQFGGKGRRTKGKYYVNISNNNSVNSPDFNKRISKNNGRVKKQNLDQTPKNLTNATETILTRKIKQNCKSNNDTLDSIEFDLNNTKRKLRPKRTHKQCDDETAKNIDSMNISLRSRDIERKGKLTTCNKKIHPNKQMKYTMRKKEMPNINKSNDLNLSITRDSLRSSHTSFKSR